MPFGAQFVFGLCRIPTTGLAATQGRSLFRRAGGALGLKLFVVIAGCADDRDRIASVFQREAGRRDRRHTLHVPTSYPQGAIKQPSAATLAPVHAALTEAASQSTTLLRRGGRGKPGSIRAHSEVGGRHLAGGRSAGVLPPRRVRARDAEGIEESAHCASVRLPGFMGLTGPSSGLFFGVHVPRKDRLHTVNPR